MAITMASSLPPLACWGNVQREMMVDIHSSGNQRSGCPDERVEGIEKGAWGDEWSTKNLRL